MKKLQNMTTVVPGGRPRLRKFSSLPGVIPRPAPPFSMTKAMARALIEDFQEMETLMASGVLCPIERMVVELSLSSANLRSRERAAGISMTWAKPVYASMKRHNLQPEGNSWAKWLQRYSAAKQVALLELS